MDTNDKQSAEIAPVIAEALAQHQRVTSKPGGPCWCGQWPRDDVQRDTWMDHVASELAPLIADVLAQSCSVLPDEVLGTYAAGCRKCGWQGQHYDFTDQTREAQRALARAEIREHKAACDMWFQEDDRG